jgi:hypothetical protein
VTDPDLVAEKLAVIETSVRELRTLARPEEVARDVKEQRDLLAFVRTIRARLTS